MYSSEVGQTDDTPFITANGDTVGQGTIACPIRYKFGTIVEIQGIRYKCNDRMHERYDKEIILMFGYLKHNKRSIWVAKMSKL